MQFTLSYYTLISATKDYTYFDNIYLILKNYKINFILITYNFFNKLKRNKQLCFKK